MSRVLQHLPARRGLWPVTGTAQVRMKAWYWVGASATSVSICGAPELGTCTRNEVSRQLCTECHGRRGSGVVCRLGVACTAIRGGSFRVHCSALGEVALTWVSHKQYRVSYSVKCLYLHWCLTVLVCILGWDTAAVVCCVACGTCVSGDMLYGLLISAACTGLMKLPFMIDTLLHLVSLRRCT